MRVSIGSDHAAIALRQDVAKLLRELGHEVHDCGTFEDKSVDYPDFAKLVCAEVSAGRSQRAVLVCGSGIGMAISANKFKGCRAAVLHNEYEAEMSRRHNDANIACFGARQHGPAIVERCLKLFMETAFEGGRHEGRVSKINSLDR